MDHEHHHQDQSTVKACCHTKKRTDWLLWISGIIIVGAYSLQLIFSAEITAINFLPAFTNSVFELINKMWWGLLLGIIFVGFLAKVPQELVMSILGKGGTFTGLFRATMGGVLLDLCSHGILVVGMQLYKRGSSLGQTMAFLIASPWNSLSLTLILWALVGLKWTLILLGLSMAVALISGMIFDLLVRKKVLPSNPNRFDLPADFKFWETAKKTFKETKFTPLWWKSVLTTAWMESKMVLRWIFFGVVLAALLRTFLSPENFQILFGPTVAGLGITLLVATVMEVCSEGSTPIAADILTRAGASGNAFAFLMTGVSTDYTEIAALKETTKSWKISLFLPLVTLPQVILLALILNQMS